MSSRLLEPITIGAKECRNRVVVTSHSFSPHIWDRDESGDKYAGYLERRARGGAGLVGATAMYVQPVDRDRAFPYDHLRTRLQRFADVCHRHGSLIVVQLQADGAAHRSGYDSSMPWDGQPLMAFDATPTPLGPEVAHRMSSDEIEALVEGFGRLAELAVECGLDGVELHGGHGYLLQQSISPWMNHRDDAWGERLHFWKAVLERVRSGIGRGAILGARVASDDLRSPELGGLGKDGLRQIAVDLTATGYLDYLNPTHGSDAFTYSVVVGTYRRPHGEFLPEAAAIRRAIDARIPVIGVGRITSAEKAEAALENGECDLVGLTRAHIADPDFVDKLRSGRANRIRPCVGANIGCIDRSAMLGDEMCFHNPDVGRDHRAEVELKPVRQPRRVLVVGAGPAGMKAAETAARRGHGVTLVEQAGQIGGRLARITRATSAHELTKSIAWLANELQLLGVDVRVDCAATQELISTIAPDAIVLATGSRPAEAAFPSDGSLVVCTTEAAMDLIADDVPRGRVLVRDDLGNEEGAVVVEQLATSGFEVTVSSAGPIAPWLGFTHAIDHLPRLLGLGCQLEERMELVGIAAGQITTRSMLTGDTTSRAFDYFVHAHTRVADDSLESIARELCSDVRLAGDALSPRDAMLAFLTGHEAGRRAAADT